MTSVAPPDSPREDRRPRGTTFLPWLVLAAAVVAIAWLTQLYFVSRGEAALLRDQVALTELSLRSARQELEAERIVGEQRWHAAEQALANVVIVTLAPAESQRGSGAIAWSATTQQGVLTLDGLPVSTASEVYHLWIRDAQRSKPVDAGSFTVNPTTATTRVVFKPREPVEGVTGFAVTREPVAGATTPRGDVVLRSGGASL